MNTIDNNFKTEDLARMCEVAIILNDYETKCEDLHDFYTDHVHPLFEAWLTGKGSGLYKYKDETEQAYISEYANRVARELYPKKKVAV